MVALARDVQISLRSLLRDRGFAAAVVLTLATCIGANTVTFAIVNSVLLRPLPVPESQRILLMSNRYPKAGAGEQFVSSSGDYFDRRQAITAFQEQAMFRFGSRTVNTTEAPERIASISVTPSLFSLLRVRPMLGRAFTEAEGEPGNDQKVILSHGLWQQLYGGNPAVLGQSLRIDGQPLTIVGVMPAGFVFVNPEIRLWTPLAFSAADRNRYHSNNWYNIGRLRPGATLEQAQAQVDAVNKANLDRFPQLRPLLVNAGFHTRVEPLQEMLVRDVRGVLYLLWGGALFVLFLGALNVANLVFARLTLRTRDLATRMALGAGRGPLIRQFLVESELLALTAGAVGLALGDMILRWLPRLGLDHFPRAGEVQMDLPVVLAGLGGAALSGLVMSVVPLLRVFTADFQHLLRESGRTGTGGTRSRSVRRSLVVGQVAFAFVLLMGAGLFLASFQRLLHVDPGFRTEGVVTASVSVPRASYGTSAGLRSLVDRLLQSIKAIPGVVSAGVTTSIPFGSQFSDSVLLAEGYVMAPHESVISPQNARVTPGYFQSMDIHLVRGRFFDQRDQESSLPVVIVDEWLASKFWPGQDPIGRRVYQPRDPNNLMKTDENTRWLTVVGVVRSTRLRTVDKGNPVGAYYFPFDQDPPSAFTFAIYTNSDEPAVARAVRAEFSRLAPDLALFDVRTMAERSELSVASRKTAMTLALAFGGLALFLSAVGVYSVLAYLVTQRRREIGIRVALGSQQFGVVKLVLREGLMLVSFGLVAGMAGAFILRKAIENEIYGVRPWDPVVLASVVALLGLVGLAASVLPARRATRVNPVIVLNEQ